MIFIDHRVHSLEKLAQVPKANGIEVDVRYHEDTLILEHDPFRHHLQSPLSLESLLQNWQGAGPLILNIKTEGIEERCLELVRRYQLRNWFFLDLSMPYFVKYAELALSRSREGFGLANLAVRFSDREAIEYALGFSGKVGWVWVDCFQRFALDVSTAKRLHDAGFQICLVSPELQNHPLEWIPEFRAKAADLGVDAVCTKQEALWKREGR